MDDEDDDYEIKRFRDFKGTVIKSSKGVDILQKENRNFKYNNFGNHGATNWCLDGRLQRVFGFNFDVKTFEKKGLKKEEVTLASKQFLKSYQNRGTESSEFVHKFSPTVLNNLKNKKTK